ncbi:hypothetical protein HPB48_021848 [Haemaphysalis longicornis]|uniref:Nose resistant-to-fluoxetine protein N-terminal domain-containing protein n=1 Tax=Haemaphysalis longicornis TaxID=44386 RepID=A0A9J6H6C0_HAELO|nr:hypothetical protein HPB48_021848 [Haemaphysalis longicornis]
MHSRCFYAPYAVFDASGKYPTGLLQATTSDPGSFDECVETVVRDSHGHVTARGQYCNLFYFSGNNSDVEAYIVPAMAMAHSRIRRSGEVGKGPRHLSSELIFSGFSICFRKWFVSVG